MVPVTGDGPGTVDASALRAAGTHYPPEVDSLYTTVVAGMFGPNLTALRDQVVETAPSGAPYDLAERLLEILSSPVYTYDTDLGDIDCRGMSTPECFATSKHGFCQQYSMTMAVVLRDLGVPARIVVGFLPGERSPGSGLGGDSRTARRTRGSRCISRVGWVAFDPTAGALPRQMPAPLPPSPVDAERHAHALTRSRGRRAATRQSGNASGPRSLSSRASPEASSAGSHEYG